MIGLDGSIGQSAFLYSARSFSNCDLVPVEDSFAWTMKLPDGRVEIVTRYGRRLMCIGDKVPGGAECPMTFDELIAKFRDFGSVAAVPIRAEQTEQAHQLIRNLETLRCCELGRPLDLIIA